MSQNLMWQGILKTFWISEWTKQGPKQICKTVHTQRQAMQICRELPLRRSEGATAGVDGHACIWAALHLRESGMDLGPGARGSQGPSPSHRLTRRADRRQVAARSGSQSQKPTGRAASCRPPPRVASRRPDADAGAGHLPLFRLACRADASVHRRSRSSLFQNIL